MKRRSFVELDETRGLQSRRSFLKLLNRQETSDPDIQSRVLRKILRRSHSSQSETYRRRWTAPVLHEISQRSLRLVQECMLLSAFALKIGPDWQYLTEAVTAVTEKLLANGLQPLMDSKGNTESSKKVVADLLMELETLEKDQLTSSQPRPSARFSGERSPLTAAAVCHQVRLEKQLKHAVKCLIVAGYVLIRSLSHFEVLCRLTKHDMLTDKKRGESLKYRTCWFDIDFFYNHCFSGSGGKVPMAYQKLFMRWTSQIALLREKDAKTREIQHNFTDNRIEKCRICMRQFRIVDLGEHSIHCQEIQRIEESVKKIFGELNKQCLNISALKNRSKFDTMLVRKNKNQSSTEIAGQGRMSVGGVRECGRGDQAGKGHHQALKRSDTNEFSLEEDESPDKQTGDSHHRKMDFSSRDGFSSPRRTQMSGVFDTINEHSEEELTTPETRRMKSRFQTGTPDGTRGSNTQRGPLIHPAPVLLEEIHFEARIRPPRVVVAEVQGVVSDLELGSVEPGSLNGNTNMKGSEQDFCIKLEHATSKDSLINFVSQKTPDPAEKKASTSGYQLGAYHGATGDKSSGNLSELSDQRYHMDRREWKHKESTSEAGDQRLESKEQDSHLNGNRSGSQGPYAHRHIGQSRTAALSVKDVRIPKPLPQNMIPPGKNTDANSLKPKLSERRISATLQESDRTEFAAPDSPILQRRFAGGSPLRGILLNPTKPPNREDNFSVRLSVRALPLDGSTRTIKAGNSGMSLLGNVVDVENKMIEFRDDHGTDILVSKSELHARVLTKLTEMYEAYESYIKDTSKDHYNLQPDIELESKILGLLQSLATQIKVNIQTFVKQGVSHSLGMSSIDLVTNEAVSKSKKPQNLMIDLGFAECFVTEETKQRVRELIPVHNLVMESLTKRKGLVGRFKALDNTTSQQAQLAIKENDGQESSKIASVQTQKAKKAVTSMSFRFKKKSMGFGLQLGLKGLLSGGDKIDEDENENRMSVRSIMPSGCISQQTKSDAKFEFQGSAQESRFAEMNRKNSDTFSNSVGVAGSQQEAAVPHSQFESYAPRKGSEDQNSEELNPYPSSSQFKSGFLSKQSQLKENISSPRSVDFPTNPNQVKIELHSNSKLSETDQKTVSKANNSSPKPSGVGSTNLELPKITSPLLGATKPTEPGERSNRTPLSLVSLVRDRMKIRIPAEGSINLSFVQRLPFGSSLNLNSARGGGTSQLSTEELNKLLYPRTKKPHKYTPGMEIEAPPAVPRSRFSKQPPMLKLESEQSESASQESADEQQSTSNGFDEVASKVTDNHDASYEQEEGDAPLADAREESSPKVHKGRRASLSPLGLRRANNALTIFQLDTDDDKTQLMKAQMESAQGDMSPRNFGSMRVAGKEEIFLTKLAKTQANTQGNPQPKHQLKRSGSSVGAHQLYQHSAGLLSPSKAESPTLLERTVTSPPRQARNKSTMPSVPEFGEYRMGRGSKEGPVDTSTHQSKANDSRQDIQLCYSKSVSLKAGDQADKYDETVSGSENESDSVKTPLEYQDTTIKPPSRLGQKSRQVSHPSLIQNLISGPGSPSKKFKGFNVFKVSEKPDEGNNSVKHKSLIPFELEGEVEDDGQPGADDLTGKSGHRRMDFKTKPGPGPALSRRDSSYSKQSSSNLRMKYQNSKFRSSLDWQDIQPSHDSSTPSPAHQSVKHSVSRDSLTSAELQAEREIRLNELNYVDVAKADYVRLTKSDSEIIVPSYSEDLFESPKVSIEDFDFIKKLGKGAYGTVYLVRRKNTSDYYAMKIIQFPKNLDEQFVQNVINENEVFKMVEDKYVVTALFTFIHKNYICFVMEWMKGGDFKTILEENTYLSQDVVQFYMAELILAVEYLHSKGIMHRDLKPDNILIDSKGHLKLTDFGLSGIKEKVPFLEITDPQDDQLGGLLDPSPYSSAAHPTTSRELNSTEAPSTVTQRQNSQALTEMATTSLADQLAQRQLGSEGSEPQNRQTAPERIKIVGTPDYIAPEILNGTTEEVFASDWWAVGIITYESLVGIPPFNDRTPEKVFENIQNNKMEWPEIGYVEGSSITPEAQELIQKFLCRDPDSRLGMNGVDEIKNHPFFRGNIEWDDLHSQEPPEIVMEKLKRSENIKDMPITEDAHKVFEDMCKVDSPGRSVGVKGNKLAKIDMVRFDLLHHKNLKAYDNMIEEKKKCEERMTFIDKTLGMNRQLGFY